MVQCQLVISLSDLRYISLSRLSAVSTLCRGDEGCHQDFFIAKISGRQTCECWMCCVIKLGTKTRNIHLGLHSLFYTFLYYKFLLKEYFQYCLNLWYPVKGCMPGPWAWLVVMLWCECVWHIAASHQSPVTWLLPNEAHISHLAPNNGLDSDLLSMVPSLNPHYTHLCHHLLYSSCLSSWGSKYK